MEIVGHRELKEAAHRTFRQVDLDLLDNAVRASFDSGDISSIYFYIDIGTRLLSLKVLQDHSDVDVVPICRGEFAKLFGEATDQKHNVLQVAMEQFPIPGEMSAWQDIFDFKKEMNDQQWNFRRFLGTLASKKQTESEIRDDIEWTLNEYTRAMKIHRLKSGSSFLEVYVVPVIEFAENIAKFNWSKIAKGALSVRKRQVELMEAEMKAPGRECAYIFEAQKRFGKFY